MSNENLNLDSTLKSSPLYSEDLAPVPLSKRTWNKWNLAALWVGMAVCIPTYILASYMIKTGLSWQAALIIIGLANVVITVRWYTSSSKVIISYNLKQAIYVKRKP